MSRERGNLCRACGLDFASVAAFDAHRVGVHAYTFREGLAMNPPGEGGRRCRDRAELIERGWALGHYDRWTHPAALRNRPCKGCYSPRDALEAVAPAPGKGVTRWAA